MYFSPLRSLTAITTDSTEKPSLVDENRERIEKKNVGGNKYQDRSDLNEVTRRGEGGAGVSFIQIKTPPHEISPFEIPIVP